MIDCKEEDVSFKLIEFYTKECFLSKDVNAIFSSNKLSEEIFAAKFKDLVSYYYMFL